MLRSKESTKVCHANSNNVICMSLKVQPNNVKDGSTLGNGTAGVQAFAPSLDYQDNVGSGYTMKDNEMFCDSMRLHEVDTSMLQTANQLPCNPAEFLATLHSDLGVDDDALMRRAAAANSSCSLTPSATNAMLEPTYHSCISQVRCLSMNRTPV